MHLIKYVPLNLFHNTFLLNLKEILFCVTSYNYCHSQWSDLYELLAGSRYSSLMFKYRVKIRFSVDMPTDGQTEYHTQKID